jgi:hypothetical protein
MTMLVRMNVAMGALDISVGVIVPVGFFVIVRLAMGMIEIMAV